MSMEKIDRDYFDPNMNGINKNKVEDILEEDEEILVSLTPNKKVYILEAIFKGLPIVLLWAAIDTFVIVMMANSGFFANSWAVIFVIAFFALHLIPVWMYIVNIVRRVAGYKNLQYYLTNKRLIIRNGLIGIDFKIFYYSDIASLTVKVGIFDRLFKVGDLYIISTNQSAVLDDIENPYFYLGKIQKIVQDIKTDMAFPNNLRPEENSGYKTKYNPK